MHKERIKNSIRIRKEFIIEFPPGTCWTRRAEDCFSYTLRFHEMTEPIPCRCSPTLQQLIFRKKTGVLPKQYARFLICYQPVPAL